MTPRAATRGVLVAAALVAALDLALVGATRLALSSDWLPAGVNASPESLFVTWTAPRVSLLPGRIGFGSVTIRNRDPNVEFEARLTDVTMRVALLDLPARVFRVSAVRAGSLAFRLRERLTRAEATPARLARYPAIAGFPDAPLLGSPPLHVLESRSWRVHLTDLLVGEVSEIWIGSWRWTGKARVAGGFFLESGARAEVFPSGLEVESGTLAWGPESVSRETRGSVRARLPRFDTQAYPGNDVWKIVSGSADLAGSLDRLTFLSPDGDPAVSGGGGAVRIAVRLDGGRGSARLDASASRLSSRVVERRLHGSARVHVAAGLDFPRERVVLDGTRLALADVIVEGGSGAPWHGEVDAPRARLALSPLVLDADVDGRLGDARPLVPLLPGGLPRWAAGFFGVKDADVRGRVRGAKGAFSFSPFRLESGSFALDGDWRSDPRERHGALLLRKGLLSVGLGLGPDRSSVHVFGATAWFEAERQGGLGRQEVETEAARRAK